MSKPSENLARRVDALMAGYSDCGVTLHITKINGVMFLRVGNSTKQERLGKRDLRKMKT